MTRVRKVLVALVALASATVSALALLHCQAADPSSATVDAASDAGGSRDESGSIDSGSDASHTDAPTGDAADAADSTRDAAPPFRCAAPSTPVKVRTEVLATGLASPWSLAFLPNGDLLFTERAGALRLFRKNGTLEPLPMAGGPATVNAYQGGYLGLALHPQFAQKPFVYLAYAKLFPGDLGPVGVRISRFRWDRETLTDETPILDGPHDDDTMVNAGGRLAFGPDGTLYATLGDRHYDEAVQRVDNLYGKVVRVTDEGKIPSDNPFWTTPGARREVFSYGHRNSQGLAFRQGTLELWSSEHGAADGDEINRIEPGKNYGYPIITNDASAPGMVTPVLSFSPSIAPSGATFYASNVIPGWCGDLFVAGLISQKLLRVRLAPGAPPETESLFEYQFGRIRDVAQGPDGYLYFIEDHPTAARLVRALPD